MEYAYSIISIDSLVNPFEKQKLQAFFNSLSPIDIFCVQDIRNKAHFLIQELVTLPYHYYSKNLYSGIYSAHPIINLGSIDFHKQHNGVCIWADIVLPKDTVRVYSFHLQSNRPWGANLNQKEGKLLKKDKLEILRIFYNYPGYSQRRANQVQTILEHVQESPYRVILCGDLNDVPLSLPYNHLQQQFKDTFKEAGWGIGQTYTVPGLRIDYIFVDQKIVVKKHQVYRLPLSDHYPIEVQIQILD